MQSGNFYTVSTPIGNLDDFSKRAIDCLNSVDIIACEDKRVSSVLLSKFGINKKLMVYQKHNEQEASQKIIELINEGKNVALVSDAGVPCISDPGKIVVKKLYENGIKTINIPGPCAITTILASAPRVDEKFVFSGFLPRTNNEQETLFSECKNSDMVFYESPKRLLDSLKNIVKYRGETQMVAIGRELTKKFEEVLYDTAQNLIDYFEQNTLKGEIVGILYKYESQSSDNYSEYEDKIKKLLKEGFSAKDIALIISTLYKVNKKDIYTLSTKLK